MSAIQTVAQAKEAFPQLRWRDANPPEGGEVSFAICGGDKETGDITIFLVMGDGAKAPLHRHRERGGWPFRETITCFAGEMHGTNPHDDQFVLKAGQSMDLTDDTPHRPHVLPGGFALVVYRQPAGSDVVAT
ncbi:hypothetical protein HY634_01040 [Candidatus Uhrbacteria bacterium]|nr:hypothetical protein [Candidatus Uhrbacteria bacterium]